LLRDQIHDSLLQGAALTKVLDQLKALKFDAAHRPGMT